MNQGQEVSLAAAGVDDSAGLLDRSIARFTKQVLQG